MFQVRIIFQKPGWFLTDARSEVLWDGQVVYDGSFMSGFDVVVDAAPGRHALRTQLHLGPIARTKDYVVEVSRGAIEVRLRYSRFWGNFKSRVEVGES